MSFAIYGESDSYVHLVTAETSEKALSLFLDDIHEVGASLKRVFNVYAVEGNHEDKDLEDYIENMINEAQNES